MMSKGTKIELTGKSLPLAVVVKVQAPKKTETFPSERELFKNNNNKKFDATKL